MEKQAVFYGAGYYATHNIERWVSSGIVPLCFSDIDEKKHYKSVEIPSGDKWEILPLDEAITRYPDYELYLTLAPKHLYEVTIYLRDKGIPQERIKYADDYQWGLDCVSLDMVFIYGNRIAFCCGNHVAKIYEWFRRPLKNYRDSISELYEFRHNLRELHKIGVKGPCNDCDYAKEGVVSVNLKSRPILIGFNTGFDDDTCNLNCVYCIAKPRIANKYGGKLFDVLKQIVEYYGENNIPHLQFACGEFFSRRDAGNILEYLYDKRCRISFATSASIYSELFVRLVREGKVEYIQVSLDSGTRETYKKIKRRDLFDRVVNNLLTYSAVGLSIELKYIFLSEINDNMADIEGFIDIAEQIKVRSISISADVNSSRNRLPKRVIAAMTNLYNIAGNKDISVGFQLNNFHPEDVAIITGEMMH